MAKVANKEDIERTLRMAEYQWGNLPGIEAEIDNWDPVEQLDFIEEWPLEEERLRRLKELANGDLLNDKQIARYERLKRIVARNRPIIRRLQTARG